MGKPGCAEQRRSLREHQVMWHLPEKTKQEAERHGRDTEKPPGTGRLEAGEHNRHRRSRNAATVSSAALPGKFSFPFHFTIALQPHHGRNEILDK